MIKIALARIALAIIMRVLVDPIKYLPAKAYIERRQKDLSDVVDIFADNDPQDEDQLKALWEDRDEEVLDDSLLFAAQIIRDKVKDEFAAQQLALILEEIAKAQLLDQKETILT